MLIKMLAIRTLKKCAMAFHSVGEELAFVSSYFMRFGPFHGFSNIKYQELMFDRSVKKLGKLDSFSSNRMFSSATEVPLSVGSKSITSVKITPKIVELFAEATGDWNPVHFSESKSSGSGGGINKPESNQKSSDKVPIAHGALLNGIVSGVMGTKLPGPGTVVVSQEFRFPAPLKVGSQVTVEVEVVRLGRREVNVEYKVVSSEDGVIVMDGTARLMVPKGKIVRVT